MNSIRVLIADDHSVLRAGLAALLEAQGDIEVVGQAADGLECLRHAKALEPDVIRLDINMPGCNGLEALPGLREACPDSRVLVLTMLDDVGYLSRVLASGGAGYVLKHAAGDELLGAIRAVHDGQVFLHPQHARALADVHRVSHADQDADGSRTDLLDTLSERESEVFRLVALGHTNAEIAGSMFLSVKTIETYKARLMRKLGVTTRAELVRVALRAGVLT